MDIGEFAIKYQRMITLTTELEKELVEMNGLIDFLKSNWDTTNLDHCLKIKALQTRTSIRMNELELLVCELEDATICLINH